MTEELIEGGFIIISRRLFYSQLMDKPPLYFKLWAWMIFKANFKNHEKLNRGQFLTSISEMEEEMSYYIGARKMKPTRDQIRNCYEAFAKASMITISKTTRGMIITILNYERYQNIKNYGTHTETHHENFPKPTAIPHYKGKKEEKNVTIDIILDEISAMTYKVFSTDEGKEIFSKALEALSETRKTKKLAPSVILKFLQELQKYSENQIVAGMKIFLEKNYHRQGKKESYLLGIIRNHKPAQISVSEFKSTGSPLLDDYYQEQYRERVSH